jgi:hypothetical protein
MHIYDGAAEEQLGFVQKFRIITTDDLDFIFGLVTWPSARPEVRAIELVEGLSKYERLVNAGRLSLIPVDQNQWLAEVNVMKFNGRDRQTLNRPTPEELDSKIKQMIKSDKPVLFDCVVDKVENCFPMIPSGKAHNEMILSPEDERETKISKAGKTLV